jgi:hypothetical protein
MTQHTQAPWTVSEAEIEALVDPENSQTYYAPVCSIDTEWGDEIWKANARLIASAPELLEALKKSEQRIIQLCETVNVLSKKTGGIERKVRVEDFADVARAAIAKATGE